MTSSAVPAATTTDPTRRLRTPRAYRTSRGSSGLGTRTGYAPVVGLDLVGQVERPLLRVRDLAGREALAEDPVGPRLVDEHDRGEDHRHPGHHRQRVRRVRGVLDRERGVGVRRARASRPGRGSTNRKTTTKTIVAARGDERPALATAGGSRRGPRPSRRRPGARGRSRVHSCCCCGPAASRRRRPRRAPRSRGRPGRPACWRGSRMSPSVLMRQEDRAVGREQAQGDEAAEQGVGVEQREQVAGELAVAVLAAPAARPRTMLANATPHSRAGQERADEDGQSQLRRQFGPVAVPRLLRYSNATPRRMSATRMSSRAR